MGRKDFTADLKRACEAELFDNVHQVQHGEDDGSFKFVVRDVCVTAIIPDLGDYPKSHTYFLFVDGDETTPPAVAQRLTELSSSLEGLTVSQMLHNVSTSDKQARSSSEPPSHKVDADSATSDEDIVDNELVEAYATSDDDDLFFPPSSVAAIAHRGPATSNRQKGPTSPLTSRIIADLRKAKEAGFKVGVRGNLDDGGYLCVSCRISKLGISEEAMKAWGVEPTQYLMLITKYLNGYVCMENASKVTRTAIKFHVGVCKTYKPSLARLTALFDQPGPFTKAAQSSTSEPSFSIEEDAIVDVFIDKSINELMNGRALQLLALRYSHDFSWTGAELCMNDLQGKVSDILDAAADRSYEQTDAVRDQAYTSLVTADHLGNDKGSKSLPLAMFQFTLRHFVRCTDFCLNCHCYIGDTFEALKPYVCSKPLCLYQYLQLGFGPSIEWEITSQKYVVDLLISFCYSAAVGSRLKDFPDGLGINVPDTTIPIGRHRVTQTQGVYQKRSPLTEVTRPEKFGIRARIDISTMQLTITNPPKLPSLHVGQWLAVKGINETMHAQVLDTQYWPKVQLSQTMVLVPHKDPDIATTNRETQSAVMTDRTETIWPIGSEVACHLYDQSFDQLSADRKRDAIAFLIDTLPDVSSMREYLVNNAKGASLGAWTSHITPFALNVLRWIIASNRSCIVQVGGPESVDEPVDQVFGMENWAQFRFAQGSPDKEQRFIDAVSSAQKRLKLRFPTIFAWHGSPLQNWHGIVREGLHYKDVIHGRAYGNGVYLSQHFGTSKGFSGKLHLNLQADQVWHKSQLQPTTAIALNEVINAPDEFLSRSPYLVLQQLDWIQARYLFVQGRQLDPLWGKQSKKSKKVGNSQIQSFKQDPTMPVSGDNNGLLSIPITAISRGRREKVRSTKPNKIKQNLTEQSPSEGNLTESDLLSSWSEFYDSQSSAMNEKEDDAASVCTNESDREMLRSDETLDGDGNIDMEDATSTAKSSAINLLGRISSIFAPQKQPVKLPEEPTVLSFTPGKLDPKTLPLLATPSNASTVATKYLSKELNRTMQEMESIPFAELGWSIMDPSISSSVYQWIVELHSFDLSLPLARDMAARSIQSIVLEIRFTSNAPHTPPFIRVIRPRFLDFAQGGGGHVTAGGALCMELLTNSGWNPASTISAVLLQVRLAITSQDPRPARLARNGSRDPPSYGVGEAMAAYKRACRTHGWDYPREFDQFYA